MLRCVSTERMIRSMASALSLCGSAIFESNFIETERIPPFKMDVSSYLCIITAGKIVCNYRATPSDNLLYFVDFQSTSEAVAWTKLYKSFLNFETSGKTNNGGRDETL